MGFSQKIKEDALVAAARHCCVCRRFKGLNIEVHHITPQAQGGKDTFANAIPLCPYCPASAWQYFAGHPRGIKLSPTELRKHKISWYKIVSENNIEDTVISDHLHFRHIIFETSILEILKGNIPKDVINNPILSPNNVGSFMKAYLENKDASLCVLSKGISYEDYERQYPNATKDASDSSNVPYIRIPSDNEMRAIGQMNLFSQYLFENGVPTEEICKILAYDINKGCGGECERIDAALYEELYERKYYLQTIVITNISDQPIKLRELICNSTGYVLQKISVQQEERVLALPNVPILPNHNVVIPTAIISNGFELDSFNVIKDVKIINLGDWYDAISQVSMPNAVEYIGEVLEPLKLVYQTGSKTREELIHRINYNSLYLIHGGALCGSCPHMFFENENGELTYGGELFSSKPDVLLPEKRTIPDNTIAIIIAELEQETAYIAEVNIDNTTITFDKQLNTGDYCRFETSQCSEVTIIGSYLPKSNIYIVLDVLDKYRLTQTFIKKWNNNAI